MICVLAEVTLHDEAVNSAPSDPPYVEGLPQQVAELDFAFCVGHVLNSQDTDRMIAQILYKFGLVRSRCH